jgi:uncharacterized protein involved in response to NO
MPGNPPAVQRFALFSYGFRPFFLLAGLYAALAVPAWIWIYAHNAAPFGALPPHFWHGHEMLYGFAGAAIAGFLLTAVPSWTQSRGFGGLPVILLTLLWLGARIFVALLGDAPMWLIAVVELSFFPAVAALIAPPLLRARNRNTPLLAVLAVLWLLDVAFMVGVARGDLLLLQRALRLAIDLVLILVTVIGGRIVPAFTGNALRSRGQPVSIVARPWLDRLVIALMVAVAVVDVGWADAALSGWLAAIAALAHAMRLSGWAGLKTLSEPIVWALHLGYAWLPIGFALKAVFILTGWPVAAHWLHAFTMGVFGTMILAVMTRAALGHTGRPLVVSPAIATAYLILAAAVMARVFGAGIGALDYRITVLSAGVLWTLAFLIYVFVYAPILIGPRADGRPG